MAGTRALSIPEITTLERDALINPQGTMVINNTTTAQLEYTTDGGATWDIVVKDGSSPNFVAINTLTPPGGIYVQLTDSAVITATTVETDMLASGTGLGSLMVPANTFKQGDSLKFLVSGPLSAKNNDILTIRAYEANGDVIFNERVIPMTNATTGESFRLTVYFTIRQIGGAGTASIISSLNFTYGDVASTKWSTDMGTVVNSTTFRTDIHNTLDVTAQFSSSSAENSIQAIQAILTKVY